MKTKEQMQYDLSGKMRLALALVPFVDEEKLNKILKRRKVQMVNKMTTAEKLVRAYTPSYE